MDTPPEVTRRNRNVKALLVLGLALNLISGLGGGLLLALGYSQPEAAKPVWQFGQYLLIFGLVNLAIYLVLIFQLRR